MNKQTQSGRREILTPSLFPTVYPSSLRICAHLRHLRFMISLGLACLIFDLRFEDHPLGVKKEVRLNPPGL